MTVPRLGDLPEPVLELLVMCLVDAAYDCEHAAKSFRAHFDGNAAAEEFTADAVRSIVREMAHEGMLQFFHAACTPEKQCFEPPPRKAQIPQGRVPEFEEVNPTPADFQDRTCILTDSVLVNVFENLGRSDSVQAMRGSRCLRSAGKSVKNFGRRAVFVEEGHSSDSSEKLCQRLVSFVQNNGDEVEEMALRNTAVAPFWKQAGESLLKVNDLTRCFTHSFTKLQRLILHSFKSQEIMAITSHYRFFPEMHRLELLQCCLDASAFSDLAKLPSLSTLGIWGLKNTQISLPETWPDPFHLNELCLDPVEATSWPTLEDLSRLHLCTSRPRLALRALPASLQVLSLTTSAQDVSNPFVEAFVLLDEHVQMLLSSLPLLVDLVLSGHMKLGPCSISTLAEHNLIRLGLAKCKGLDSEKAFQAFLAFPWSTLEGFEIPGSKNFKIDEIAHVFPKLHIFGHEGTRSLVPQAGQSLARNACDETEAMWWEEVIESRRPSVGFSHSGGVRRMNSPLASLAHISHFLQQPGDFGVVCRGP